MHTCKEVAATATRADVLLHMIPGKITSVLQPLDAYVFATFKRVLRSLYEEALLHSVTGTVLNHEVLPMIINTINTVVRTKDWRHAFEGCGWGCSQARIVLRFQRRLRWQPGSFSVGDDPPDLPTLQCVWPGKKAAIWVALSQGHKVARPQSAR